MNRREPLAGGSIALVAATAGCLDRLPGIGLDVAFETTDVDLPVGEPPEVTVDGDTVTARGTVQYGSSSCGTVELAHAGYERSQSRLDLLVVAGDESGWSRACTDDLVERGYRVTATVDDSPARLRDRTPRLRRELLDDRRPDRLVTSGPSRFAAAERRLSLAATLRNDDGN